MSTANGPAVVTFLGRWVLRLLSVTTAMRPPCPRTPAVAGLPAIVRSARISIGPMHEAVSPRSVIE